MKNKQVQDLCIKEKLKLYKMSNDITVRTEWIEEKNRLQPFNICSIMRQFSIQNVGKGGEIRYSYG